MLRGNRDIFRLAIGALTPAQVQWLRDILIRHPYYQEARLRLTQELHHCGDLGWGDQLRILALQTADRDILFKWFEEDATGDMAQAGVQTAGAVPSIGVKPAKMEATQEPAFMDRAGSDTDGKHRQHQIIERFLQTKPSMPPATATYSDDKRAVTDGSLQVPEDLVSETLAKIYAKQGKWEQAIKVYERLILQVPEKKAKFAAQILELQHNLR